MKKIEPVEEIPDNRSVIIVSDLHLGLRNREGVPADFLDFVSFLKRLLSGDSPENPDLVINGRSRKLLQPGKIILLGDIIDLWSPRDDSRASVLADFYPVFQALLSYPAEVVYVAGNHDDEISEYEGLFPVSGPGKLKIIKRHYPEASTDKNGNIAHHGIRIGMHEYFFMHGQQFDLLFNVAGLLQNYPGWVARNCSLFKENADLKILFQDLFGVTLFYFLYVHVMLGISTFLDWLLYIIMGISLVVVIFSIEPSAFRDFWDKISMRKKTHTETIETIIEAGFWKKEAGDTILADTVVFGHTHVADDSKERYLDQYHKRFLNSGSWGDEPVKTPDGRGVSEKNTFVYIDAQGPVLFHWPEKGPVPEQIRTTLTGDFLSGGMKISNIRLLVRQNILSRG